ncbi:hypothetical protein EDL79_02055 [Ehrlichia ruminantium]|uniref:Outer membrane protein beta-barrel domain-containing protein n=1 Tax=Ehrlichia ruminantium TaxID=779 RepID=A0AAE6Q8W0_EHRRU|nr:outer membrane beta-barrel protein [Ehrlichia ruminantium]QGR02450.1 hypothetical protein EDL81_02060 [Ehrlichia ruminantium]QGR03369.1 hypothetical protein EDL80_02055 [Ehrlichia ruminantium]QGR04296.1 hypothetical protein EDL79_02055 [Ehrlichia ruminantium]
MRIILYLQITCLLLFYSGSAFAQNVKTTSIGNFYIGGAYGYNSKILEFKTGRGYFDFDFNINNVRGYDLGLTLGYIFSSASLSNLRTELELMYIGNKKVIDSDTLHDKKFYWGANNYRALFNLYYNIGNFLSIKDLSIYFGSGVNVQNIVNHIFRGNDESLNNSIFMQAMIGIKYKLISNVAVYTGYRYIVNYVVAKKGKADQGGFSILGSSVLIFGLEFIF